ncbi:MAG TPA: hypothetical protein EYO93_03955 [Nitrososphaerales archaeon]|nr:hypothetical protein [Nitrososphaerales archaeon]
MWQNREKYKADITVVTALFKGENTNIPHSVGIYDPIWVDKLYRGIARHYSGLFDFVCLTDANYKFEENIRQVRLSKSVDQYGWMSLMDLYRPDLCDGKRFTAGLDTIITGSLDDILAYDPPRDAGPPHEIALCRDPNTPDLVCNAVTLATPKFCEQLWELWQTKEEEILEKCIFFNVPSEMAVMRNYYNNSPKLDVVFPQRLLSYKMHLQKNFDLVKTASIVYFHGKPKPQQLIASQGWIKEYWR